MDIHKRHSLKHLTPEEKRARLAAQNLAWYHAHKNDPGFRKRLSATGTKAMQKRPWKGITVGAINRAKKRGIPYDADLLEWAAARYTGRCELTGLEFRPNRGHGCGPAPFSPSIDRIDPALGYTKGNCRFILHALNALKGAGTDADMERIIRAAFFSLLGRSVSPAVPREAVEPFFPTSPAP